MARYITSVSLNASASTTTAFAAAPDQNDLQIMESSAYSQKVFYLALRKGSVMFLSSQIGLNSSAFLIHLLCFFVCKVCRLPEEIYIEQQVQN